MTLRNRIACFLGFHPRLKNVPREWVYYVQQRSDCGAGRLYHQCPRCGRWHSVSEAQGLS